MTKWSPWRSVLAGAVIGFVEAAGSERERHALRRPEAVVRLADREPAPGRPAGLWFLTPFREIRRWLHPN